MKLQTLKQWCETSGDRGALLLSEWNYSKNQELGLNPNTVSYGSTKKVYWICSKCKYEFCIRVSHRTIDGQNCKVCTLEKRKKDRLLKSKSFKAWCLENSHKDLLDEWDITRNFQELKLSPETTTYASHSNVWWKCIYGHSWQAVIKNRVYENGSCPFCSGKKPIIGKTDLATTYPDLVKEWDQENNNDLKPELFTAKNGNTEIWWKCSEGHSWQTTIYKRTMQHTGCPFCSGRLPIKGTNDFETWCKKNNQQVLLQEWDYQKNKGVLPSDFKYCSGQKFWWKCHKCNYEWEAPISHRVYGHGCKRCNTKIGVSNRQNTLIEKRGSLQQWCESNADIGNKILKEWHSIKNINITPDTVLSKSAEKVWWLCDKGHEWKATICSRTNGSACPFCVNRRAWPGYNDLSSQFPEVAAEWDYSKNGNLTPQEVLPQCGKVVWWKCGKCGFSYSMRIQHRTNGHGCKICGKNSSKTTRIKTIIKNKGSLLHWCNENGERGKLLLKEWDYSKNTVSPSDITFGSNSQVWWKCKNNHTWQTQCHNRTSSNPTNCPFCSNKRVLAGYNDLQTWCINNNHEELLDEWNSDKNGEMTPSQFMPNSMTKVWWKCIRGHEWESTIGHRINGRGCPFCKGRSSKQEYAVYYYVKKFFNAEYHCRFKRWEIDVYLPDYKLGIEFDGKHWHESESAKEKDLRKENYLLLKHNIQTIRIKQSTQNAVKKNCIYYLWDNNETNINFALRSLFVVLGKNIGPSIPDIDLNSIDYQKDINTILADYRQIKNNPEKSVASDPRLYEEWDNEKNGVLRPENISLGNGNIPIWWKCQNGHSWKAVVTNRTKGGCPVCSNKRLLVGYNDLLSWCNNHGRNDILDEWDYDKNIGISPSEVSFRYSKKVWWKCKKCGNVWQMQVGCRTDGRGCPICRKSKATN